MLRAQSTGTYGSDIVFVSCATVEHDVRVAAPFVQSMPAFFCKKHVKTANVWFHEILKCWNTFGLRNSGMSPLILKPMQKSSSWADAFFRWWGVKLASVFAFRTQFEFEVFLKQSSISPCCLLWTRWKVFTCVELSILAKSFRRNWARTSLTVWYTKKNQFARCVRGWILSVKKTALKFKF